MRTRFFGLLWAMALVGVLGCGDDSSGTGAPGGGGVSTGDGDGEGEGGDDAGPGVGDGDGAGDGDGDVAGDGDGDVAGDGDGDGDVAGDGDGDVAGDGDGDGDIAGDGDRDGDGAGDGDGDGDEAPAVDPCAEDVQGGECQDGCTFDPDEIDCDVACGNVLAICGTGDPGACSAACEGYELEIARCVTQCNSAKILYCGNEGVGCFAMNGSCADVMTCFSETM